ncbi:MAG: potassium transporter TrkA [Actinomycetota bacterium]|nr:potassium transporter TrkA [Actinomycetota bacterium]
MPTRSPRLRERLRYRFDSSLSRGPSVLVVWLAGATVAFLLVAAAVISVAGLGIDGGKSAGFFEAFWQAMLRVFDSGTFSGDNGWALRVVSLAVTLAGILVVTSLIGLVASSIDQRITNLGKGRSPVLETGHVLVLGWSPRLFSVLSELVEANANQRRAVIVILAEESKADMDDAIRARIGDTGPTRIVCRTGDPASPADLELVNATGARSIVVMAGHDATGDAAAVRATLAVLSADSGGRPPVVVEMLDGRNARALSSAAGGRVLTVEADDIIAKVTAQACYQAGLGVVYRELLDFAGDEIYFAPAPELAGHTFGEALSAYETSTVVGRRAASGAISLAPDMATMFEPGDQVVALSADDDTVVFSGFRQVDPPTPGNAGATAATAPTTMLVIGWSPLGARILTELDAVATGPRSVDVAVDDTMVPPGSLVATGCERLVVRFLSGADDPDRLGALVDENGYDHVVVLGYRYGLPPAAADARTLLTLLTLAGPGGSGRPDGALRVVAEVLDSRDAVIAERTGADDLVVSDQLSSLMIAQLTEHPELIQVFDALFDPAAPSIAVRPAAAYVAAGPVPFAAVVAAARVAGEVALGYRLAGGRVVVNPPKSAVVSLGDTDNVIVLG